MPKRKALSELSRNPHTVKARKRQATLTGAAAVIEKADGKDRAAVSNYFKKTFGKCPVFATLKPEFKKALKAELKGIVMLQRMRDGTDANTAIAAAGYTRPPKSTAPHAMPDPNDLVHNANIVLTLQRAKLAYKEAHTRAMIDAQMAAAMVYEQAEKLKKENDRFMPWEYDDGDTNWEDVEDVEENISLKHKTKNGKTRRVGAKHLDKAFVKIIAAGGQKFERMCFKRWKDHWKRKKTSMHKRLFVVRKAGDMLSRLAGMDMDDIISHLDGLLDRFILPHVVFRQGEKAYFRSTALQSCTPDGWYTLPGDAWMWPEGYDHEGNGWGLGMYGETVEGCLAARRLLLSARPTADILRIRLGEGLLCCTIKEDEVDPILRAQFCG